MGVISFGECSEDIWGVAGWAFRGYLNHVLDEIRGDSELEYALQQGMALDGLHFPLEEEHLVNRLLPVMRRVADQVIAGQRLVCVQNRVLDERSQRQFRRAVRELRELLQQYRREAGAGGEGSTM